MFNDFFQGFYCPFRGLKLLFHPGWRALVWLPILVNTLLFGGGMWWAGHELTAMADAWIAKLPSWFSWLSSIVVPLIALCFFIIAFYAFTIVANFLASPFNSALSERVEDTLAPTGIPRPTQSLFAEILSAFASEVRKLVYFILRAIPLFLLLLIPGLNAFSPFAWGAMGAWMLALGYFDYPLGNHGLNFPRQRKIARAHFMLTMGFGCAVLVMTLIPVLNFLSMPSAVIGATLLNGERKLLENSAS